MIYSQLELSCNILNTLLDYPNGKELMKPIACMWADKESAAIVIDLFDKKNITPIDVLKFAGLPSKILSNKL